MAIITSRCTVDIPSIGRLPTDKGTEYSFGNASREPMMGDSGLLGHKEEYTEAPMIKCKIVDTAALDKGKLQAIVDETITVQTNNGQTYTLNNAFYSDVLTVNAQDGSIEATFYGSELLKV